MGEDGYKVKLTPCDGITFTYMVRSSQDVDQLVELAPRYGYDVSWAKIHLMDYNEVLNELVMAELGC